jgi:alpha-1,2-glucosyltransferase
MRAYVIGFAAAAGASALLLAAVSRRDMIVDEVSHVPQIRRFASGQFATDPELAMLPGYHVLMAGASRLFGFDGLAFFRGANALLCLGSLPVFWAARRHVDRQGVVVAGLQYYFLPVLFPIHVLVYTDVLAVALLLLAALLAMRRAPAASAAAAAAALLVRQMLAVWLPLLLALNLVSLREPRQRSRAALLYAGVAGAFLGFVAWNGGPAIGDVEHQPFPSFHTGNVHFFLAVSLLALFPLHLGFAAAGRCVRARPGLAAGVVLAVAAALAFFRNDHDYNQVAGFVRNDFLIWLVGSPLHRALAFPPLALVAVSMLRPRIHGGLGALFWASALASLSLSWLVEPRYSIAPLALWLLLRERESEVIERAALGVEAAWSAGFSWALVRGAML